MGIRDRICAGEHLRDAEIHQWVNSRNVALKGAVGLYGDKAALCAEALSLCVDDFNVVGVDLRHNQMCIRDSLESAEEICTSFAVLEHGFLRASGDLSMLTAASELTPMAVIRVSDTQKMPEDFTLHDGAWEKPIESEADMPELISGLVRENVGIYEASVCTSTLQDVYYAFVKKPGEEDVYKRQR